jgi:hypothetical protein
MNLIKKFYNLFRILVRIKALFNYYFFVLIIQTKNGITSLWYRIIS